MTYDDQFAERERLEQAIAGLAAQRSTLGDAVVDAGVAALRQQIAALQPVPEQQRKLATLLFLDIAGHTAMTAHLDPEDQMALVDNALARLAIPIERYGGRVVRFQGDGFKAVFGLPLARENDPAQAIRAGLAIQEEARQVAQDLQAKRGLSGFQVRVGITTGLVFAGGGTEGEDAVTGAPVSLAARLESAAEPGTVLISRESYSHVRGVFDVEPQTPIEAKGFSEPVPVYRVLRAKARPFYRLRRGVEGVETRMVGREVEFLRLQKLLEEVLADSERQMVTVIGEAGLGKSRLLYEFENWVDLRSERIQLYKGRARLETQGVRLALLRDLLAFRFEIQDDDPMSAVRAKLETAFISVVENREEGERYAHVVGQMVGYDFEDSPHLAGVSGDPRQLRESGTVYLGRYFRAVARQAPILLLLEDLHWADDSSLDVLNQLVEDLADWPLLVVGAARHSLLERRPHWSEGQTFHHRIPLTPLSKRDSRRLVEEVLQKLSAIPDALRELLVSHAEGNPFYVEELVKMLVEEGVVLPQGARWEVAPDRLAEIQVPPTLMGVLQARLDGLAREEKRLLQQASVVGRIFWDRTLAHMRSESSLGEPATQIVAVLDDLRGRELIFRRETSAFDDAREHLFKHALLRDVTYESVLKRDRRRYHALVAEWLLAHAGDRAREMTGLIADHLDLAGDQERARHYLLRAGQEAAAAYANEEALRYFDRALAATPTEQLEARYGMLREREQVYSLLGRRAAQAADIAALAGLAAETGRVKWQAETAIRESRFAETISDYEAAIVAAERAVKLAREGGVRDQEASAHLAWGSALYRQSKFEQAWAQFSMALENARVAGTSHLVAHALRHLALLESQYMKDYVAAREHWQESLSLYQQLGDRQSECMALNNLGSLAMTQWDVARGLQRLEAALSLERELGFRRMESMTLSNLGLMYLQQGDFRRARRLIEQSLAVSLETGNRAQERFAYLEFAVIARFEGDSEEAYSLAEKCLALARNPGPRGSEAQMLNLKGITLIGLGQWEEALDAFEQARLLFADLDDAVFVEPIEELHYHFGLAHTRLALGQFAEAERNVAWILAEVGERSRRDRLREFELGLLYVVEAMLVCYKVLVATDDPRAPKVLSNAYALVIQLAETMPTPEAREQFLRNFPGNREIVGLYSELRASGSGQ